MWGDPDPDPGGQKPNVKASSPQELLELQEQNEQQLVLIAQLKEMLRKEQSSVTQEKVEEYVNTLNKAKAKRSRQKRDDSGASISGRTTTSTNIDSSKKERINLLRQQLEENKARLAERGKSQKGIEEMVTQLQAQFNDSQALMNSTPLNVSLTETKNLDYNENTPQKDLYNILLTKEKKISELLAKSQKLEGNVMDLQENLKEKDLVIDARTKAITLMTDSLSKKGKNTLDALEETKEQMRKMQENFVTLEAEMKARQITLLNDLKMKNFEIGDLQQLSNQLERENEELKKKLSESERSSTPTEETENPEIETLRNNLEKLQEENEALHEKVHEFSRLREENQELLDNLKAKIDKNLFEENQSLLQRLNSFESRPEVDIVDYERLQEENRELLDKISELEKRTRTEDDKADYKRLQKENRELFDKINELEKESRPEVDLADYEKLQIENKELLDKINELEKIPMKSGECSEEAKEKFKDFSDENKKLLEENSQNLLKISELEKQLDGALTDLRLLKNTGMGAATQVQAENEEITKLKKQLDESNKNMIKMRANQKAKVKELNKRLDQFKKMSDSNALISQLQSENSKLNEKVAELEDEKGNLQLKMVESTGSSKGDPSELEDQIKQLENKILLFNQDLEEKNKVIEILEAEISLLKADIKQKSEEQIIVSSQVSSEMSSIHYEEQIEKVESEKKKILEELDGVRAEKEELLKELEVVKKEKHDVSTKLENYIQENMELIDKLEKLSAEKVSSAESIEIVEGLTKQEQLELAAYQKHLNPEDFVVEPINLKGSQDDVVGTPVELNESVLQLGEETAELLHKIEMFTQERKEVMLKMETLREENSLLSLKVKEIENNRDVLEETYEQLQNEKEALASENQELIFKLEKSIGKENAEEEQKKSAEVLDSRLKEMQIKCEALVQENDELKRTLKDFDTIMQEKYDLENRLREAIETNTNLELRLKDNLEEINSLQLVIEDNKHELISSSDLINTLQNKVQDRENDIQELNNDIANLNDIIGNLQSRNSNLEALESELQNLKAALTDQMAQAGDYETEIAQNSETVEKLNQELINMKTRIIETETLLEVKDGEIQKLAKEVSNKEELIKNLQDAVAERDTKLKSVDEIKEKYMVLQKQLDNNSESVQRQVKELTQKNKEQLDKLKKLAANLKKKTQAYQELEEQYSSNKEKWETEGKEKDNKIQNLEETIASLSKALKEVENQLKVNSEENRLHLDELNSLRLQVNDLEQTNTEQSNYILELKHKQEKLTEVNLQQEMSASLHEDVSPEFSKTMPEEKIRELEMLLETNESDLNHQRERILKLEETISKLEEEKSMLEVRNAELIEKLDLTSYSFKEKALLEDQLELRLAEVSANDEVLSKKLQDTQKEYEDLQKKNQENEELIKKLKIKLKKAHDKVTELKGIQTNVQELEITNQELKNQVTSLEANQKHIQSENESLQRRNLSDYEKIEADYQIQLEELLKIKNDLTVENEKLLEKIKEQGEKEQELTAELDEYRLRLDQSEKTNIEEINSLNQDLATLKEENNSLQYNLESLKGEVEESNVRYNHLLQEKNAGFTSFETEISETRNKLTEALQKEKDSQLEIEQLTQKVNLVNEQLYIFQQEKENLQNEIGKLKQEVEALEFARTSLEASYESTQKLNEKKFVEPLQPMVLEEFSQKSVSQSQEAIPTFQWPDQKDSQQEGAHLFDAFAQQNNGTSLQDFAAPTSTENWFNQSNISEISSQPILPHEIAQVSVEPNLPSAEKSEPQPFSSVIEEGREALLKKIKTLEFLLYSVDKEKEIALDQCVGMVNDLTQLICESSAPRETEKHTTVPDLESQILSQSEVDSMVSDKHALRQMEYTPIKESHGEQQLTVKEDPVSAKKAYICHEDDELMPKKTESISDVESQIMSQEDVTVAVSNKKELQKLEYENIEPSLGEQQRPVVESLAQPKHAYLCYTKDDKPQSLEAFEENDDGWGWGPEEAKLEEEHLCNVENTPQVKNLLLQIQQLKDNITVLQVERENHLEEIRQLQVKSGKLIKKYKELKARSDRAAASTSKKPDDGGFFDLNETIQEELKEQLQRLEKRIVEINTELDREKAEKNNLLKRVDVLTAANDRMTEMKEIQDTEVLRWKRKYQEATEKLQEYEWGNDGFGDSKKPGTSSDQQASSEAVDQQNKIQELESTIRDLTLDNEELQTILEEHSKRLAEAERTKVSGNDEELNDLRTLNESLHNQIKDLHLVQSDLESQLFKESEIKDSILIEKLELENLVREKESKIIELVGELKTVEKSMEQNIYFEKLEEELLHLKNIIVERKEALKEKELIITDLQNNLEQLGERKLELDHTVMRLTQELDQRSTNIEVENKVSVLQEEINSLKKDNTSKQESINELNELMKSFNEQLGVRQSEYKQLEGNYQKALSDIGNAAIELGECHQIIGDLQERVKQTELFGIEKGQKDQENKKLSEELQEKIRQVEEFQKVIQNLQKNLREVEVLNAEKSKTDDENTRLVQELELKTQEVKDKERLVEELQLKNTENVQLFDDSDKLAQDLQQKEKDIESLKAEIIGKDVEIQRLLNDLQNKEQQFEERVNGIINELNENWQVQVDQRGTDVAESWKMHLEMVEKDYTTVQEKLKEDIAELEEKCNILVNENNELRKNVDQEIRNEVDRLSALQQQITNHQQTIGSLNLALQEKDKQIEEIQNNLSNYVSLENQLQELRAENSEKDNKLASINIIIETTQKQFDEKREVVEEIVSILEKTASSPISYEKQDILEEFQRQLGSSGEKDKEISRLSQVVRDLEEKFGRISGENDREIIGLNQVIEDLERELSVIHEKESEIIKLSNDLDNVQSEKEQLLMRIEDLQRQLNVIYGKEDDILRLSSELTNVQEEKQQLEKNLSVIQQEKENMVLELEKLRQEHSNCQVIVQDCQQKVQEHYNNNLALQQSLEEKDRSLAELRQQIAKIEEGAISDTNKQVETLNISLSKTKEEYAVLQETLTQSQSQLYEATQQLAQKSQELDTANQNLYYYQQSYTAYEKEINRLRSIIDQREKEYNDALERLKNNQLTDIQRHYDELLSNKDLDIGTLRAQVEELLKANQEHNERLAQELSVKQELEQKIYEQDKLINEDTKQLEDLKFIIEEHVAKIDELKKQLFDKSNQYDSLIAEIDVGRVPVTQQPAASSSPPSAMKTTQYQEDDLSEPVSRAELDLALYMLHQRDVRCEELTIELTHLLEERDTLQLKLSTAIREKEELRKRLPEETLSEIASDRSHLLPQNKSFQNLSAASGAEATKEPLEMEQQLAIKLSELKNVGYKRDKTFVDEQEARRLQQFAIMQQHIHEASKLPPEAAAKLVDASYTLSRDVQSPPKVLLNWLWGKNPPRASDT